MKTELSKEDVLSILIGWQILGYDWDQSVMEVPSTDYSFRQFAPGSDATMVLWLRRKEPE